MPEFSRHSSRSPGPTVSCPQPSGAFRRRSRAAACPNGLGPKASVRGFSASPSPVRRLSRDGSKFHHPPSFRPKVGSACANDGTRCWYQQQPASWLPASGFTFPIRRGIFCNIRQISGIWIQFRPPPRRNFGIRHCPAQGCQCATGFFGRRKIIPHPIPPGHVQIRHRAAKCHQAFRGHTLDVKVECEVDQLGFVIDTAVGRGIRDQIVVQCNGRSHASNDAHSDSPFNPFPKNP